MHIEEAGASDWPEIRRIYLEGIGTGHATFEVASDVPGADASGGQAWFGKKLPGLVFKAVDDGGQLLGWCAVSGVSDRCVYKGVAEVSVYVAEAARGQGVGMALMEQLVQATEEAGIWTLQAGVFPENKVSIRLHEKVGFRVVGVREKLGQMNGVWRDVMLLERRAPGIY
jgi:phosphinothricin acetyltransferase